MMEWGVAQGGVLGMEDVSWEEKEVKGRKFRGAVGRNRASSEGAAPPTFLSIAQATKLKLGLRLDISKAVVKLLWELEVGR
jgi:hypothetical protein